MGLNILYCKTSGSCPDAKLDFVFAIRPKKNIAMFPPLRVAKINLTRAAGIAFFLGNHPIVSVRYVYLVISETKEKRFTDYLVLPERDGW